MNNNFFRIGLEIHCQLDTEYKMFSQTKINTVVQPNTDISNIDVGEPGTLPRINPEAFKKTILLSKALNANILDITKFERKNYFYLDLPKGFQISQLNFPIGKDGYLEILSNKKIKKINIDRIQLEEDTAKQFKIKNTYLLDFNRCGIPLVEIITQPDFSTSEEVIVFLKLLINTLKELNISKAQMELGTFRIDVNISVYDLQKKLWHERVEIKNLNSFLNIKKAIDLEFHLQSNELKKGNIGQPLTKKYDEKNNQVNFMRWKMNNLDYTFFNEANLPFINVKKFKTEITLPNNLYLQKYLVICKNVKDKHLIEIILANDLLLNFIYKRQNFQKDFIEYCCFFIMRNLSIFKNNEEIFIKFYEFLRNSENINDQIKNNFFLQNKIFNLYYQKKFNSFKLAQEFVLKNLISDSEIRNIIDNIFLTNKEIKNKYFTNPEKYKKYITGTVMKKSKGNCDPKHVSEIISIYLKQKSK